MGAPERAPARSSSRRPSTSPRRPASSPRGDARPDGAPARPSDVAVSRVARVAAAAQGRARGTLVLCTSHRMCARVAEACRAAALARDGGGEAPRATQLAADMRRALGARRHDLALDGVDLPRRRALVAVDLDRSRWPQPGDPVREDAIRRPRRGHRGRGAAFRGSQPARSSSCARAPGLSARPRAAARGALRPAGHDEALRGDVLRAIALPRRSTGPDDGLTWLTTGTTSRERCCERLVPWLRLCPPLRCVRHGARR